MGFTDFMTNEKAVRHIILIACVIIVAVIIIYMLAILRIDYQATKEILFFFLGLIAGFVAGGYKIANGEKK